MLTGLLAAAPACKTAQTSALTGVHYDEQKNTTTLILIPYGGVTIPGKWKDKGEYAVSRQHYFTSEDSGITLAVTKNPRNIYPFNQKQYTDNEFTRRFVAWDTAYFHESGKPTQIIADSSDKGFILFHVSHPQQPSANSTFLYGAKNGICYNFSASTQKWSAAETQAFLTRLYHSN